jgi:hypothetical protein
MPNKIIKKYENLYLQRILDCSLAGIYVYDFDLQVNTYINSQYSSIIGHTLESLKNLGESTFIKLFQPDDLPVY